MFYTIEYNIGDNKTIEVKIFQPLAYTNAPAEIKYVKDSDGKMIDSNSGAAVLHASFMGLVAIAALTMWSKDGEI